VKTQSFGRILVVRGDGFSKLGSGALVMTSSKLALTFVVQKKERVVKTTTVSSTVIKIGSDVRNQIRIEDEAASLMHAIIEVGDEPTLIDLGSVSGTWVNGARVNRCRLCVGDEIRVGSTIVQLEKIEKIETVA
jgi:pSer/pThr/pTyr-binding forkhead associated (FHA) protein